MVIHIMKTNHYQVQEIKLSYSPTNFTCIPQKVQCSNDAKDILLPFYNADTLACQEEFLLLLLNRSNKPLGVVPISKGGISGTIVDIKLIMSVALKSLASGIILSHNHPSGNLDPSEEDIKITQRIKSACELLDIKLLDHIIMSPTKDYTSFADKGNL